jgi:hypothetical protein
MNINISNNKGPINGGYLIVGSVQKYGGPPTHHLQGNGNEGNTSLKHMQWEITTSSTKGQ